MIGSASRTARAVIAERPTPPTPKTAADCPRCTFAVFSTAPAPVITAQPMMLVTSRATSSGTRTTYSWRARLCSDQQ